MQTLVLRIPDALGADLDAEARRSKTTKSDVARRRLLAGANGGNAASEGGFELIRDLVGSDAAAPSDFSARKKHYLKARGFGRAKPRR
jgi:hypothetical protein